MGVPMMRLDNIPFSKAEDRLAFESSTPSKSEFVRLALDRFVSVSIPKLSVAPVRFAPVRFAPVRFAKPKSTPVKLALLKFTPCSSRPLKEQLARSALGAISHDVAFAGLADIMLSTKVKQAIKLILRSFLST